MNLDNKLLLLSSSSSSSSSSAALLLLFLLLLLLLQSIEGYLFQGTPGADIRELLGACDPLPVKMEQTSSESRPVHLSTTTFLTSDHTTSHISHEGAGN